MASKTSVVLRGHVSRNPLNHKRIRQQGPRTRRENPRHLCPVRVLPNGPEDLMAGIFPQRIGETVAREGQEPHNAFCEGIEDLGETVVGCVEHGADEDAGAVVELAVVAHVVGVEEGEGFLVVGRGPGDAPVEKAAEIQVCGDGGVYGERLAAGWVHADGDHTEVSLRVLGVCWEVAAIGEGLDWWEVVVAKDEVAGFGGGVDESQSALSLHVRDELAWSVYSWFSFPSLANVAVVLSSKANFVLVVDWLGQRGKVWWCSKLVHHDDVLDELPFVAHVDEVQFDDTKIRARGFGKQPFTERI